MGGLGGAINAALCYLRLPVAVGDPSAGVFSWHIVPAGAAHGAILAAVSIVLSGIIQGRPWPVRWIGLPAIGWMTGWLSFIPIQLYITSKNFGWKFLAAKESATGLSIIKIRDAILWPFAHGTLLELLWLPLMYFGLVSCMYALLSAMFRKSSAMHALWPFLLVCCASGVLGSLWWWIGWKPWYFSLIHGTIWGALVGFGVWKSQQTVDR